MVGALKIKKITRNTSKPYNRYFNDGISDLKLQDVCKVRVKWSWRFDVIGDGHILHVKNREYNCTTL